MDALTCSISTAQIATMYAKTTSAGSTNKKIVQYKYILTYIFVIK